jgi:hypothetical protein
MGCTIFSYDISKQWVPVIGSLLATPAWYFAVQSGVSGTSSSSVEASFELSMIWLAMEYFVAECWFGPTISSLQATVGTKIGGTAQGLFSLTGAAANAAPALLGYLYGQAVAASSSSNDPLLLQSAATVLIDHSNNNNNNDTLSGLLTTGVCLGYVSSAFCFAMASRVGPTPSTTTTTATTGIATSTITTSTITTSKTVR